MPIKKGVTKAIGAVTPVGKGKENKIKQEVIKKSKFGGSAKGTEADPRTKRKKIASAHKQLVIS